MCECDYGLLDRWTNHDLQLKESFTPVKLTGST